MSILPNRQTEITFTIKSNEYKKTLPIVLKHQDFLSLDYNSFFNEWHKETLALLSKHLKEGNRR